MRWEKMNVNPNLEKLGKKAGSPGKRWGHTANSIKGGKFLYVFGGYGKDNCQTNDVHVFDITRQAWSKPIMKGIPPSPRDSHSCTTVGNNLFIFGGTDGKDPLKDLHILDTSSNTWISPSLRGEGPEAREGHSAALIGKRLFIFGGCGKSIENSDEVYYNDLFILDTDTLVWRRALTSGPPPSARDSHTCSSWKHKIIVVAGEDASDYYLSDVHILDTDTLVWRELCTSGQTLPPRAGHSTVTLGKNMFVYGGFTDDRNLYDDLHMLNLDTGIWTKILAIGEGPSARFSVAGDCLDPWKGVLIFIGGCNEHLEALEDMFYLHTDITTENGLDEQRPEKLSIKKELKRKCQEQCHPMSLSLQDRSGSNHRVTPNTCKPTPLTCYGEAEDKKDSTFYELMPSQKRLFEAKVTETFHYGYTIETNIGGKPLRGILFSYKPSFANAANAYLSGKSICENVDPNVESVIPLEVEVQDHRHANETNVKESTPQESLVGTAFPSSSNSSTPVDDLSPHMLTEDLELSKSPIKDDTAIGDRAEILCVNPFSESNNAGPSLLRDDPSLRIEAD